MAHVWSLFVFHVVDVQLIIYDLQHSGWRLEGGSLIERFGREVVSAAHYIFWCPNHSFVMYCAFTDMYVEANHGESR